MPKYFAYYYNYHFVGEALLTFMILLPVTFAYYDTSHYVYYPIIVIFIALLFYMLERKGLQNLWFLLVTTLAGVLLYFANFPIGLVVIFPVVFLWRYMRIRRYLRSSEMIKSLIEQESINKANLYIKIGIALTAIVLIYSKEYYIVYYFLLLIFVLYVGYLVSHISTIEKGERKEMNFKVFSLFPVPIALGAVVLLLLSAPIRLVLHRLWLIMWDVFLFILGPILAVIEFLIPESIKKLTQQEEILPDGGITQENVRQHLEYNAGIDDAIIRFFTIVIIFLLLSFIIYRLMRKQDRDILVRTVAETEFIEEVPFEEKESILKRLFKRDGKIARHPVRKLIYQLEKDAKKYEVGRYPFESIDEWFERLKLEINVETYKKVRYGQLEVTKEEIEQLEKQIKNVKLKQLKEEEEI